MYVCMYIYIHIYTLSAGMWASGYAVGMVSGAFLTGIFCVAVAAFRHTK